jgi:type I restriction enzyme, S subunit
MVDMVDPQLGEKVLDPACGTGGFLTCAIEHVRKHRSKPSRTNSACKPASTAWRRSRCRTCWHHQHDAARHRRAQQRPPRQHPGRPCATTAPATAWTIVTNPPFGGMEEDGIENNFPATFRTRETADLFLVLIMHLLKDGGRAAVVLPDGTLFGEGIKTRIKEQLLETCNLHTIVRLPNGVFNPYTGIKTNLLFFTKGSPPSTSGTTSTPTRPASRTTTRPSPCASRNSTPRKAWWQPGRRDPRSGRTARRLRQPAAENRHHSRPAQGRAGCRAGGQGVSVRLSEHLPLLAEAPDGIKKLRGLILELAVRGKLVPQDPSDEPASELLKRIAKERTRLEAEGACKKSKQMPPMGEDEQPFAVPSNWEWLRLGDIALFENGDRSKNYPSRDEFVSLGIPFINAGHLRDHRVDSSEMNFIPESRFDLLRSGKTRSGDVLFCLRGSLGKFAVVTYQEPAAIASSLVIVRLIMADLLGYLESYLSSPIIDGQIQKFNNGTAQPNLGASDLFKFVFPLPPLSEQHRIVTKVDELMALCDRMEAEQADAEAAHATLVRTLLGILTKSRDAAELAANWQRLSQHFDTLFTTEASLDALKQTILQLAVMGKLVPQDPTDEPASELLRRIAAEKARLVVEGTVKKDKVLPPVGEEERPFELPVGWDWIRLGNIVTESGAGWSPSCESRARNGDEWGVLKVSAVSWGEFDPEANKALPPNLEARPEHQVEAGDFLVSRANTAELVARSVFVDRCPPHLMLSDKIVRLRLSTLSEGRYINLANSCTNARDYYSRVAGGTSASMKNVSREQILSLAIPLPPLAEQHRIVAKVDELMALCDSLKADLAESRARQARLATTLIESALQAA